MRTLPYTEIKSEKQYDEYCKILWELDQEHEIREQNEDAIELLCDLIEKWQDEHCSLREGDIDPIELLTDIMEDHKMKNADLANLLSVSEDMVADILHYRRRLSEEMIRKLCDRFKIYPDAFNKPYPLISDGENKASENTSSSGKNSIAFSRVHHH